jgi:hypothetical protein
MLALAVGRLGGVPADCSVLKRIKSSGGATSGAPSRSTGRTRPASGARSSWWSTTSSPPGQPPSLAPGR